MSEITVPPRGTRGDRLMGGLLLRLLRPFSGRRVASYRKSAGAEPPTFMGFPVLLLTTIGARTGQERTSELGCFEDGPDAWLIVASKGGSADHPAWFLNIARNPDKVWAEVGTRRFRCQVEQLRGEERARAYQRIAAAAPTYAGYPKKTDREIPVLRLRPAAD